jgi:hypothetical protein
MLGPNYLVALHTRSPADNFGQYKRIPDLIHPSGPIEVKNHGNTLAIISLAIRDQYVASLYLFADVAQRVKSSRVPLLSF